MTDPERWLPVPGCPPYRVSSHGRVRGHRALLRPDVGAKGHQRVTLRVARSSQRFHVHRLVLLAFVGPAPADKPCGLHEDDNPSNNHLGNLRWGTKRDNARDAARNGRLQRGSKQPGAKLDEMRVRRIKQLLRSGASHTALGRAFGVTRARIGAIADGRAWKHVL